MVTKHIRLQLAQPDDARRNLLHPGARSHALSDKRSPDGNLGHLATQRRRLDPQPSRIFITVDANGKLAPAVFYDPNENEHHTFGK